MHERFYTQSADAPDPAARPYYRYLFDATEASAWYVEPVERVWLTETHPLDRLKGTVYACPLDTVHTIGPRGNGFVATVVVQGPHVRKRVPVYAPAERCPKAYEGPIAAAELNTELVALERALDPSHTAETLSLAAYHVPWSIPDAAFEDNRGAVK
jgi:hypothetical protein